MRTSSINFMYVSLSILIFGYFSTCLAQTDGSDQYQKFYEMSASEKKAYLNKTNPTDSRKQAQNTSAFDTSAEESTCVDIGFKRKTPAFANCVLQLLERKDASVPQNASDPDDATCRKYGFKPKTNEYATCRQQIDQARAQAAQQQAQYLQQQKQYQAQLDEQQRQRSVAAGLALMQLGTGISSGTYNANNAYGTMPTPPNPNRTYILPGGRTMNCTTTGTVTNCF
jgi:hypothetical protein